MARKYAQLIAPLIGTLVMAGVLAYRGAAADNTITGPEWVLGVTQLLMVVSVWGAVNVPGWSKGKKVQAAIFAVLALLAALVTNGLTGDELMQLVITGLSALGVVLPPSVPSQVGSGALNPGSTLHRSGPGY